MVSKQDEEAFAASIFIFSFGPPDRQGGLWDKRLRRGEMKFEVRRGMGSGNKWGVERDGQEKGSMSHVPGPSVVGSGLMVLSTGVGVVLLSDI